MAAEVSNSINRDNGGFDGFSVEAGLAARIELSPRDKLVTVIKAALDLDPDNLRIVLTVFRAEKDPERREDLYRAIRSACVNSASFFSDFRGEALSEEGFRSRLTIVTVPTGARQGAGLLTDFHLVSQLCLSALGNVRPLPLPERFPVHKSPSRASIVDHIDPTSEHFKPEDFGKTAFGRSSRFSPQSDQVLGDTRFHPVLKAARSTDAAALSNLQFEAAAMDYLRQHKEYFGIESDIPVPLRGPSNRVPAWRYEQQDYLHYGAPEGYFKYLDEISSPEGIESCGTRVARDLMRLARFGIFHTEPAPIFHSVTQQRRFLWNVGGLLPGAGDLEYWRESFQHSNFRETGIADFEHLRRWRSMPAVVSIVNDTEDGADLGFQYHLGNALFCTIHVMALGYHRLGKSFADYPGSFQAVMKDAYRAFTGSEWSRYDDDIDEAAVISELGELGSGPHVGEFSGAYPHQNFIKALYAFTLRAIPEFMKTRAEVRASLPEPNRTPLEQPHLPMSVPSFVIEFHRLLAEVNQSAIVSAIVDAGLPPELQRNFVHSLRGVDLSKAQMRGRSEQLIAVQAHAIVRILGDLLPTDVAQQITQRLTLADPFEAGKRVPFEEFANTYSGWCFQV